MKIPYLWILLSLCSLFAGGCLSDPYGVFEIEAVNTVTGVSAGCKDNAIILTREDRRQVINVSTTADEIKLFNSTDAPVIYGKVHFFGEKGISILKISLPEKDLDLNRYLYQEIGTEAEYNGKKVNIIDLKEVSPDGKRLSVTFVVRGIYERISGSFYPETQTITVP